jgi:hypothetical protein
MEVELKKKQLIFVLFILFISVTLFPAKRALQLNIPLRAYESGTHKPTRYIQDLKGQDIQLTINGAIRPIAALTRQSRSLSTPTAGRFIALSFDVSGDTDALVTSISHFVEQVVQDSDQLVIRTPIDLYTIKGSSGKVQILKLIKSILQNDLLQQQRNKTEAIATLNNMIENTEMKLDKKKIGIRASLLFANHFHEGWRKFYKNYLLANLSGYSELATRFAKHKGEKYIIHFQERAMLPMLVNFKRVHQRFKTYARKWSQKPKDPGKILMDTLAKIQRSMMFSRDFPMTDLLNILLGVNVGCHTIFLDTTETKEKSSMSPGYETILKTIALQTGGITFPAANKTESITAGLNKITAHNDHYYNLVFHFNGKAEDKKIQVQVHGKELVIFQKSHFKGEEFRWLMQYMNIAELAIDDYTLYRQKLTFKLSGYRLNKGSGSVKVTIRLIDNSGSAIYQTHKNLNATGQSVSISLDLPQAYKGYFKLSITAIDLMTNKSIELKKYIKLD